MRVKGHIDSVNDGVVRGWARDRWLPNRRLVIDLFAQGVFVGQTIAGFYRADLVNGRSGDGFHGFRLSLPPDRGPVEIDDVYARVSDRRDAWLARPNGTKRPHEWSRKPPRDPIDRVFGPLLDQLGQRSKLPVVAQSTLAGLDALFEQAADVPWPLSAFARHIAHKFGRASEGEPTEAWYENFVVWYLSDYALTKAPDRLPLNVHEVAYWRSLTTTGAAWAQRLLQSGTLRGDWAIDTARAVSMEDCLVDPLTIQNLRRPSAPWDRWRSFPLSRFMARFKRANDDLARLPALRAEDRQRLYALIMLYAARSPHLLGYLPRDGLHAMLNTTGGTSPFTRTLARACPSRAVLSADEYTRRAFGLGFDVEDQSWRPLRRGGYRSSHGTKPAGPDFFDIQIIGPFRKTLGLAQSCRRLGWMMSRLPFRVNYVDYDLGNASASQECSFALGPPSVARINILHLNLDEIPEAMAFLPDVFSPTHTIAFPYWELNKPSACHRLGLALVDEIWVASTFLDSVLRPHAKTTTQIGLCPDPTDNQASRAEGRRLFADFGIKTEDFVFLAVADALSWVQRKNILGVVEAFLLAHPDEPRARLLIKTHNLDEGLSASQNGFWAQVLAHCRSNPRIVLVNVTLDARSQSALLAGADCLVSLHRAEGLGLDILEAMRLGVSVIATDYGGVTDACTSRTSWLVDCDIVAVPPEDYVYVEPGHVWAAPRAGAASFAMREVMSDTAGRETRCEAARRHIAAHFGEDVVGERIDRRLSMLLRSLPPMCKL